MFAPCLRESQKKAAKLAFGAEKSLIEDILIPPSK
jgi:hypothetical protein